MVAGKGHEEGQKIGKTVLPFSDHDAVKAAIAGSGLSWLMRHLWTADELVAATGGTLHGRVTQPLNGVTIDSRNFAPGDIFVAIKGETHDGHDFAANALKAGAGLAIVSRVDGRDEGGRSACWKWRTIRCAALRISGVRRGPARMDRSSR